ncbi:MAG: flhB [Rhodocyclaceae bacterium]|nr:flhB [Rhodocyclaceae bacterium]
MAESSSADKSEKASPQKLRKAREQGQVVRSRDLSTTIGILVSLKLIVLLAPAYLEDFRELFGQSFAPLAGEGGLENAWSMAFAGAMLLFIKMILPLFAVPAAIVVGSLFPGGWVFSSVHLTPRLDRLDPVSNLGRLFSGKRVGEVAVSIVKALTLGAVLVYVSRGTVTDYLRLQGMPLDQALLHGAGLVIDGLMALCLVFVLFAFIDLPVQSFFFLRGQRMSKQEVKEEYKTSEGRPEVRQRIRQLQRQLARRGVRKTVPTADAVIVNPEHYAVALKYDENRAEAPFVVAKGVDAMALYIREVAVEHGVQVVPMPPLARAIYNTSQVNQQIPVPLYKAVAQVLNYVLQLKAFQSGRRTAPPQLPDDLAVPSHLT